MMFGWFRKKDEEWCYHYWEKKDMYYRQRLTEYSNGSDYIALFKVEVCSKCLDTKATKVNEERFPVNNSDSRKLKNEYLTLLKNKNIKSKEEFLLQ